MSTEQATIFTDETAEFNDIQSLTPSIDLTDWKLPNSLLPTFTTGSQFLITAAQASIGYYEIEFHLGNTFWACNFNFGNAPCGVQIRQGLAHMVDKTSFTANQVTIRGHAAPIDNPLPTTSGGGLASPNPCGYDASFAQSGAQCVVGTAGGTSYHLATATGANGIPWLAAPGSADLNAAAQHFVNAGVATGFNSATSVLTGINPAAASAVPNFFIRSDNVPRLDLGNSLAQEICYLFTGVYTTPCTYLTIVRGPITAFPGFTTSPTSVNLNWWMYTAAFSGPTFFDGSLYFGYNSRFASASCLSPGTVTCTPQVIGGGSCSSQSVGTSSAGDYQYACDPAYDNLSTQMETAPCLAATGDPVLGATSNLPTSPGNGQCSGTTQLSAHSAGIQAEVEFGSHVLTLPIFQTTDQYGYLNNGWAHVANNSVFGLSNYFTWLNAWNGAPHTPGTIRQGFKETTKSVNPFISSTIWDAFIDGNVYDSLQAPDPLSPADLFNYMSTLTTQLTNSQVISTRGYTPPTGTLLTYEFTLHNDMFFQDQQAVTAFDVAFSYLNLVGAGAFGGTGASTMTGITILGARQFDIGVSSLGPFTLPNLTGLYVFPGRYWTGAGASAWDTATTTAQNTYITCGTSCPITQYSLTGKTVNCALTCTFGANLMQVDTNKVTATYDPIASGTFIGSSAWQCGTGQLTTAGSKTCTSSGAMNPPAGGSYTLTAFGAGIAPGSCQQSTCYFRSSANLALYVWSEQNSVSPNPIVSIVAFCVGQPPVPLSGTPLTGSCAHFQQGIGTNGATTTTGTFSVSCVPTTPPNAEAISVCGTQTIGSVTWTCSAASPCGLSVGVNQFSVQVRYYGVNWIQPFQWGAAPPAGILGIGSVTPVLYAPGPTSSGTTLSPASTAGCVTPYPTGGYDC
jgi:hypothetical protein